MNFVKNLGIILLMLGFLCLVVFKFCMPTNALLVTAIALEAAGILGHIIANRYL